MSFDTYRRISPASKGGERKGRSKETPELSKLHDVAGDRPVLFIMCAATASMIRLFSSA
jgi:hypothetical protein